MCHASLHAASYNVKVPSPKEGDYQMEDAKEVKLEPNPGCKAVAKIIKMTGTSYV